MADTKYLQEVLANIASGQTSLYCGKHFYTPSRAGNPTSGCADCWRVLYWTIYARTPEDDRENFVDGMDTMIHHMVEHDKLGTWDFIPKLNVEINKEN